MTETNYLGTLTPEQLRGYDAFARWMSGNTPAATLAGRGGVGKTYSVGRYCQAYGIGPQEVLGIAPTNSAAKKLQSDFEGAGFPAGCTTAHKALCLTPEPQRWGDKEEALLSEVEAKLAKWDLEGGEAIEERRAAEIEKSYLLRRLEAFRKDALLFEVRKKSVDADTQLYRLYIVDECSMQNEEIFDLVMMEWGTRAKVLMMGDPLQLRPVGEGLSKAFSLPWIDEFTESKRAEGDLKLLHEAIAACSNPITAAEMLKNLPYWDEVEGVENPWELPKNQACLISASDSRTLFKHWLAEYPFDGMSYRMVGYKNITVDKINDACLKVLQAPCPQPGHTIVANSPVTRSGPSGSSSGWDSTRIATTGELLNVNSVIRTSKAYAPGFGEFTIYHLKVSGGDAPDSDMLFQPEAFLGGWKPDYSTIVRWTNDSVYRDALTFWDALKSSLYCKGKPPLPTANVNVERLFDLIGADSWCNFVDVRGVKTYKAPPAPLDWGWLLYRASSKETAKFNRECFDSEGRPKFGEIRKRIYRLYKWLQDGVVDPVKPLGCSTVYKAQGQTLGNTVILLDELLESRRYGGADGSANAMAAIYTAVSRSKERLYVVA